MSLEAYLAEACRWFVILALLGAAAGKSIRFGRFRESLGAGFPMLGRIGAATVAVAILGGEWLAGGLILAGGALSRIGLLLALVLFVSLTLVVVAVVVKGMSVRCNCFGVSQQRISGFDLVRNLLFITAAVVALQAAPATAGMDAAGIDPMGGLPLVAVVAIVTIALMFLHLSLHLRDVVHLMQVRAEDL